MTKNKKLSPELAKILAQVRERRKAKNQLVQPNIQTQGAKKSQALAKIQARVKERQKKAVVKASGAQTYYTSKSTLTIDMDRLKKAILDGR